MGNLVKTDDLGVPGSWLYPYFRKPPYYSWVWAPKSWPCWLERRLNPSFSEPIASGKRSNGSKKTVTNWLVVDLPLWKMMEYVSWDDDIPFPTEWKVIKFHGSKPPLDFAFRVVCWSHSVLDPVGEPVMPVQCWLHGTRPACGTQRDFLPATATAAAAWPWDRQVTLQIHVWSLEMAKTTAWNESVAYFYGPLWASGHFVVSAQFSEKRTPKIVHFAVTPKIVHFATQWPKNGTLCFPSGEMIHVVVSMLTVLDNFMVLNNGAIMNHLEFDGVWFYLAMITGNSDTKIHSNFTCQGADR